MIFTEIKFIFFLFLFCSSLITSAQEKVGPWKVIPQSEVPDSVLNLEQIQNTVDDIFLFLGKEIRNVFYIKTQFDSIKGEIINYDLHTTLEMPREPDSIELINIKIYDDISSPGARVIKFVADSAYPDANALLTIFKDSLLNYRKFQGNLISMPSSYDIRSFRDNGEYGFFLQFISSYHPDFVGIMDLNINGQINLYPNPTQDYLILNLEPDIDVNCHTIGIFDILGKQKKEFNGGDCKTIDPIDVSDFSTGKYWLMIRDENARLIARKQFVKF